MTDPRLITSTWLSPKTGTQYLIVPRIQTRMTGDWVKGESLHPEEYVQYDIVLDGNLVQFCFRIEDVPAAVAHFEGEDDGWYCLPRD